MQNRLPLMLLLALAACGGPQPELANQDAQPSEDVVALSRAAVDDSATPSRPEVDVTPVDTVALGDEMMRDAVPLTSDLPAEPEEIAAEPEVPMAHFVLGRGETLDHFARWSGFPVEDIAEFSGLPLDGDYDVGTEILLPVEGDALTEIETKRAEHWSKRLDGYLASRGGSVGTETYKVRTGDSAWTIARSTYGFPIWVLEAYNPEVDLDRLRPGQELQVPVLADIVVDAGTDTSSEAVIPAPEASGIEDDSSE